MTALTLKEKTLERQISGQPKEVKFCKRCVISNQRPRIVFDEDGVCSACRFAQAKQNSINWKEREEKLNNLLDKHRRNDGGYDVIVPCSGGKDSSYVAHQLKYKYGMHPLTVTYAPFMYTDIGFKNFQNFIAAGFNNIMGYPNGNLHRKLARLSLEEVGDPFLPFIYGQMCFPFHMALKFDIKLVFYGENGEAEYGGDSKNNDKPYMPLEDWAVAYWKGTSIDDLIRYGLEYKDYISEKDFTKADLTFYTPPPIEELKKSDIQMHWYSYYHKWIPQENYYYSSENVNFQANPEHSEGTYSKYVSLDDKLDGFHFYLGFIKFGMGRATYDANREIRDGYITREEGVRLVRRYDGEFPREHLKECLEYMGISEEGLHEAIDSFRQPHLWERAGGGAWKLKYQVS